MQEEQQPPRTSKIVLVVFLIVLLIVGLFLIRIFLIMLFESSNNLLSTDWAGYSVASDFTNPQPVVIGITSSWIVPTVIVSQRNAYSAVWIGIGGQLNDNTLIQAGTEQDSTYNNATYSAWYELLPNDSVTITNIDISPGDKITASINLTDSISNVWSIEMVDLTNSQSFHENVFYNSSRLSGEWIVEETSVNVRRGTLANFGKVTFMDSRVNVNGSVGTITNFPFDRITLQSRQGVLLTSVSSLSDDGSSFTVTYFGSASSTLTIMNEVFVDSIAVAPEKTRFNPFALFKSNGEL